MPPTPSSGRDFFLRPLAKTNYAPLPIPYSPELAAKHGDVIVCATTVRERMRNYL